MSVHKCVMGVNSREGKELFKLKDYAGTGLDMYPLVVSKVRLATVMFWPLEK